MKLWDMLSACKYWQEFDIYVGNDYLQNISVAAGEADDLRRDEEVFDHLMDDVDRYSIEPDGTVVVILKNEMYETRAEEQYSKDYVKRWDRHDPTTRPWLNPLEIKFKHRMWA